jgi:hypothetical protein
MRRTWKRALTIGLVVAAAVGVVLSVGAGLGWFRAGPAPTVTVSMVHWEILQGVDEQGTGWFGPDSFNETGGTTGFPLTIPVGSTFVATLALSSFSSSNHTIFSIDAKAPFDVLHVTPDLPNNVAPHEDDVLFQVTVQAPSTSGNGPMVVDLTVDAQPA